MPGALDRPDENSFSKVSRRKFLALLSASAAVAASGCSNFRDKGEIVPYNKKPESVTIGNPTYYASTCTGCQYACGILIKTLEGRPIKVDGNPDHPVSKGKICAIGQASVMNLYDPERLKNPSERINNTGGNDITWAAADDKIITQLKSAASSGKEIVIVTNKINSPSQKNYLLKILRQLIRLQKFIRLNCSAMQIRTALLKNVTAQRLFLLCSLIRQCNTCP